jgi:hypothetical protein
MHQAQEHSMWFPVNLGGANTHPSETRDSDQLQPNPTLCPPGSLGLAPARPDVHWGLRVARYSFNFARALYLCESPFFCSEVISA